jgi:integrase
MGSVYRKTVTKRLPDDAEIFTRKGQRFARWKDRRGKIQTAPLTTGRDGSDRIVITAAKYTAKYRDGTGIVREKATGCRDKEAARAVLTELEKRAEKVRAGINTPAEDQAIDHQRTLLVEHISHFISHQKARGLSRRVNGENSQLRRVARECGWSRLADLDGPTLERWLYARAADGMAAATRNEYRGAWVAFCNWCVRNGRLTGNPLAKVPKADVKVDRRRQRRALTEEELSKLLEVARQRPLLDRMTVRKGPRKGEAYANLRPETRAKLERLGWERALIYKTLVLTGLRKNELRTLTVG